MLNGKEISASEAIDYRNRTNNRGYIYSCVECGNPARLHKDSDNDGHFEHQDRHKTCSLCHVVHP